MHISSQMFSRHYDPICARIKAVMVGGVDVTTNCIEFDDEEGWAIVFQRSSDGELMILDGGLLAKEKLTGEIEIIMKS